MQTSKPAFALSSLTGLVICALTATFAAPASAQDKPAAPPKNGGALVSNFLRKQLTPAVSRDFDGAFASVGEFLQDNPTLRPADQLRVISAGAALLYSRTPQKERAAVADPLLQFLDTSLREAKESKKFGASFQDTAFKDLSYRKLQILTGEKRTAEAAQLLDHLWPLVLNDKGSVSGWAEQWRQVRHQQNQPQQALGGLIQAFEQQLSQRPVFFQDMSDNIISELIEQKRYDEARSWAKQTFLLCEFNQDAIVYATKNVNRSLTAGSISVAKVNQFALAQTDPKAPNPLDEVKLPALDVAALREQLANARPALKPAVRLNLLLAIGDYRGAMILAKSQLVDQVTSQDRARDVARVFKAKDGNLVRANQFLTFYQLGKGENPIPAFLEEAQAAPSATG